MDKFLGDSLALIRQAQSASANRAEKTIWPGSICMGFIMDQTKKVKLAQKIFLNQQLYDSFVGEIFRVVEENQSVNSAFQLKDGDSELLFYLPPLYCLLFLLLILVVTLKGTIRYETKLYVSTKSWQMAHTLAEILDGKPMTLSREVRVQEEGCDGHAQEEWIWTR